MNLVESETAGPGDKQTDEMLEEFLLNFAEDPLARRAEFYRYYSPKRVQHQFKQLEMLRDVPGRKLAEIGSYLGFATALFLAAGFKVRAIDAGPASLLGEVAPAAEHVAKNVLDITPGTLKGQDVAVCCETLEHLHFPDVERVLGVFKDADVPWLLITVPYRCFSIDVRYVRNPFSKALSWIVKLPNKRNKAFSPDPEPYGHKWELGYKGYPLEKLTDALGTAGFDTVKIDYCGTVKSVFILSKRA